MSLPLLFLFFFFFNDTATTEIYTLSLHDALPIFGRARTHRWQHKDPGELGAQPGDRQACAETGDRKSTRLNSSHSQISYAVFCLKKKKQIMHIESLIQSAGHNSFPSSMPSLR